MDIKKSVFRRKTAKDSRKGKWVVRLKWEDATGQLRTREKQFAKRSDAMDGIPQMEREVLGSIGNRNRKTDINFIDLVEIAKREFYFPATFEGGIKTAGIKSYSSLVAYLDSLSDYFGKMKLNRISAADIRGYREWRIKIGSKNPSLVRKNIRAEISPATINRELSVCRRLLKFAFEEGYVNQYVFPKAKAIHRRLELPRQRVLSHAEIDQLLAACEGEFQKQISRRRRSNSKDRPGEVQSYSVRVKADNPYIKPMILLAADSGLRKGEILSLTWNDIDLVRKRVTLRREVTKTEQERVEGLTDRTIEALFAIRPLSIGGKVVPTSTERAWQKVKEIAGLPTIRFHDLRRTASTVLVRDLGLSIEYATKLLGHSEGSRITLQHYVAVDDYAIDLVTERLNEFHRNRDEQIALEVSNAAN